MSLLRLRLLGGISAERTSDAVPIPVQPRRLAVLGLVAEAGDRGVARATVQAMLWPDSDEEVGRRALNQAIYTLKRAAALDDLFLDGRELRLNPDVVSVDLWEFEAALRAGDYEPAVRAYGGPFMDGFRLPQAADLDRWIDERRTAIDHRYAAAVEKLAARCRDAGDYSGAIIWWRTLAGRDPLSGRVTLELMRALAAVGERAAAIQQARIYATLVTSELEMAPDPEVMSYAESLRSTSPPEVAQREAAIEGERAGPAAPLGVPTPPAPTARTELERDADTSPSPSDESAVEQPAAPAVPALASAVPVLEGAGTAIHDPVRVLATRRRRWAMAGSAVLVAALVIVGIVAWWPATGESAATAPPFIAVGEVSDYRGSGDSTLGRPLADMLATNLARVPNARVLSTARMFELMRQLGSDESPSPGLASAAARQAGATQLVDGALFRLADGNFRLDLRRIDIEAGDVIAAYTVHGTDVFSLADSATALLARDVGATPPAGSIADVTTRSLAAYRLYEQGLRAHAKGEAGVAGPLFAAALAEDSTFAMAAYYAALNTENAAELTLRLAQAKRLAKNAPTRERLVLSAGVAFRNSDPATLAYADSLTQQFPEEIEGHLHRGLALLDRGEFATALPSLRRVIAMDSLALRGTLARCAACDALESLVYAFIAMDSATVAIREARRWTELQPRSRISWETLLGAVAILGMGDEVWAASRMIAAVDPSFDPEPLVLASRWIPMDEPAEAERALRRMQQEATLTKRLAADWYLTVALREQGRYAEALEHARRYRDAYPSERGGGPALLVAQALHDLGRFPSAAALFDTSASWLLPEESPTRSARHRTWAMTLAGTSQIAGGDTTGFGARIDSARVYGARSALCRDPRLHEHLRGLLLQWQGDHQGAVAAFQRAICTTTLGYTRTNHALAKSLLELGRAQEAVAILQPALRGSIAGSNYYITRAELHELLAQAWEAAGQRDSAAAHYAIVARVWTRADPVLAPRLARVRERLAALGAAVATP